MEKYVAEKVKIAPSILSADFRRLGEQVGEAGAAGGDYIHVDVMDGRFVPNITIGPLVVKAVRRATTLPIDVHLMIEEPERYLADFFSAGADNLTVHVEACPHLHRTVQQIKEMGCRAGVALNPATPLVSVEEILPYLDLVLIMTVNPGFGGQAFIETMLPKIQRLRKMLDDLGSTAELEVDGGVAEDTTPRIVEAGARVLVAGSAIFGSKEGVKQGTARIRAAAQF